MLRITILGLCLFLAPPLLAQDSGNPAELPIDEIAVIDTLSLDMSLEQIELLAAPLMADQLAEQLASLQAELQAGMSHIASLKVIALEAEGPEAEALTDRIIGMSEQRNIAIDKFLAMVDALERKGGDPEIIQGYRDYVTAALAAEWAATDPSTLISAAWEWFIDWDGGAGILLRVLMIFGSLFLLVIIARFTRGLAGRALKRATNLSQLLRDFLLKSVFWLTFAVGFMIVLGLFGVDITPLFAVIGGASFIIAFAMQETLGNLAAGLMIMVNKPFDVGDLIDTNGVLGEVEAVSIVSTTVRTFDNQVIILPNSSVWGSVITNVTVSSKRRVDMVFGIGYSDDMDQADAVLRRLVAEHPLTLDDPEPLIKVHELADSSVNLICRPWTKTEDYWTVYWDLTKQVKQAFDAEGISIPFPQRDVHLFQEK